MSAHSYKSSVLLNALRKYAIPDIIIGGDKDCKHEFELAEKLNPNYRSGYGDKQKTNMGTVDLSKFTEGFCIHCQAWKGQYGLEPTPQMYVEHTRLWAKEAWRVLKNDGIFFLNLASTYASQNLEPEWELRDDLSADELSFVLSELAKSKEK